MGTRITLLAILLTFLNFAFSQKLVNFKAADGLEITADLYEDAPGSPLIILCHQAEWSRGEYQETAKWFNENHFSCLAIDQRSGDAVNLITNETAERAKKAGKGQAYLDAEQDIVAAVTWATVYGAKKIIILGSSYSASLALKIAKENQAVIGVAAFSPGEYFGAKLKLGKAIDGLNKPTFITASKSEMIKAKQLATHVNATALTTYTPTTDGYHGSRALWSTKEGFEGYRKALLAWLVQFQA